MEIQDLLVSIRARGHARAGHKYDSMYPGYLPKSSGKRWHLGKHRVSKIAGSIETLVLVINKYNNLNQHIVGENSWHKFPIMH